MRSSRAVVSVLATLVATALLAAACASSDQTGEVSTGSAEYGASLETSTTLGNLDEVASITGGLSGDRRAQATENLLNALAENPALLNDLENLTPEELEELTGLDSEELGTLGITPATVGALGGVIGQIGSDSDEESIDPRLVAALAAGGSGLLTSGGELTDEARGLLAGLDADPAALAALIAAAVSVPSDVTGELGVLLNIIDPNGLGQFSEDEGALSIIAVAIGAILGRDPVNLANLANSGDIDPRFRNLLFFVTNLATTLEPELINRINNITRILGPYAIRGLAAALSLLERPAVGALFEEAFADPEVVLSSFGSALLLIPGLAELVAPSTFADPNAIYGAVIGVATVALINNDAPGFRDFLDRIGVDIPPEFLD